MGRAATFLSLLAVVLAAPALAAAPPKTLKATVKDTSSTSREIVIANGSTQTFTGFFINSTDSPKITAASSKACKLGTSPWSAKGKKHVDYWANCATLSVAGGKTVDVNLTTSGSGKIIIALAPPHSVQYTIGTGS